MRTKTREFDSSDDMAEQWWRDCQGYKAAECAEAMANVLCWTITIAESKQTAIRLADGVHAMLMHTIQTHDWSR
jgi:hypothetical protein